MRKNTLMIAAAVAALTAGSTLAFAQGAPDSKSNPASKSAPAEKMAPSPAAKPGAEHAQMPQRGEAQERSKPKSETTGQAAPEANPKQEKSKGAEQKEQKKFEGNTQREPNRAEQRERNRSTTGQGAPENRGGATQNRENREQGAQQNRENREQGAQQNRGTNEGRSSGSVNLSTEQRTKIHSIIIAERSAPRVEHVDFDVRVGTVVPRGGVRFAALPSTIVEIEPSWRGYEYFLVGDQIVVVDPATLRIVAVLPA